MNQAESYFTEQNIKLAGRRGVMKNRSIAFWKEISSRLDSENASKT